jgi:DNA-binding transcriptional MocR family regulator
LHLTLELPHHANERAIVTEAARRGIHLHGLSAYRARANVGRPTLLLGYCRLSETDIVDGAKALAALVRTRRPNA